MGRTKTLTERTQQMGQSRLRGRTAIFRSFRYWKKPTYFINQRHRTFKLLPHIHPYIVAYGTEAKGIDRAERQERASSRRKVWGSRERVK